MVKLQTILEKTLIKPRIYKWDKRSDFKDSYSLEICDKNRKNNDKHKISLFYNKNNSEKLKTLTEKERNAMLDRDANYKLRETNVDTILRIEEYEVFVGDVLRFIAYFFRGELQYSEEHNSGLEYISSADRHLNNTNNFRNKMIEYFSLKDFSEFSKYFIQSNLPDTHKKALKDILL